MALRKERRLFFQPTKAAPAAQQEKEMNKIIVMLAFAAALVTATPAHAEFVWRHFGVAPYA